jgi:outer membrane protein, heavy metal efflux system
MEEQMTYPLFQGIRVIGFVSALVVSLSPFAQGGERNAVYSMDQILQLALERSPALIRAEGEVEQSRGQDITAKAFLNPIINAQSGSGAVRDPSNGTRLTEVFMNVSQPLEWTGKRTARQQAAEAAMSGASAGMEEVKLHLVSQVKLDFYDLLVAQQTLDIAKQNLVALEEVARVAKIRVKTGDAVRLEALRTDVEVLKAQQEVRRAANAIRLGRVSLDTLTAGALGKGFTIQGEFRSFRRDLDVDDLVARARDHHPTIRRLQKLVEQADWTVTKERQSRMPDVSLYGGYTREAGREGAWAGLSVPTPIWYQRQGEVATALGAKRRQEGELFLIRNDLLKAVYQHYQDAEMAAEQVEVFEKGLLKQAQNALHMAQRSFQEGAASLLEVLDAQRVARQMQLEYAFARRELAGALSRLERAVGETL